MKILFLDIDGVLNNESQDWSIEGNWTISDTNVGILNRLLDAIPDLKIVLSSTWRIAANRGQEATFKHLTEKHGFKHASRVIGSTPDFGYRNDAWFLRGEECLEWILFHKGEPIETWAILDDQKDMFLTLPNNHRDKLVITNNIRGLSLREFEKLKEILCSK